MSEMQERPEVRRFEVILAVSLFFGLFFWFLQDVSLEPFLAWLASFSLFALVFRGTETQKQVLRIVSYTVPVVLVLGIGIIQWHERQVEQPLQELGLESDVTDTTSAHGPATPQPEAITETEPVTEAGPRSIISLLPGFVQESVASIGRLMQTAQSEMLAAKGVVRVGLFLGTVVFGSLLTAWSLSWPGGDAVIYRLGRQPQVERRTVIAHILIGIIFFLVC